MKVFKRHWRHPVATAMCLVALAFAGTEHSLAQQRLPRLALKSGESAELRNYFWVVNCQSILIGDPTLDILEGSEDVDVAIKPDNILPVGEKCAKKVPGGHVIVTAKDITERKNATLTIRLNFKSKQGDRQNSNTYLLSLFPEKP
jgi:hypothetical protein